ncbi:MAG: ABC transporter permease, partial [Halobacteriaceae archaeon]
MIDFSRIWERKQTIVGLLIIAGMLASVLLLTPGNTFRQLDNIIIEAGFLSATLQAAVPIAMAGVGGLYAEKSGVINIGLEGLLIVSAFSSVAVTYFANNAVGDQTAVWIGFFAAVLVSTIFALLFAIICIEFKADQIIAGLAIWLLALGFAPFASKAIWGQVNSVG